MLPIKTTLIGANNLHLTSDRYLHQHLINQFLQAECSSWCPTDSVKALKASAFSALTLTL